MKSKLGEGLSVVLVLTLLTSFLVQDQAKIWSDSSQPLAEISQLRKLIKAPVFKKRDFRVTDYGAIGNGTSDNSLAFKKAIEACSNSGGGRVIVPAGVFLTGPLYLKSNVNLHLENNSTLLFSKNSKLYPIAFTRWEGIECMNYSAQIYSYGEKNIAVTGNGTIDGNASNSSWWSWKGSKDHGWKEGMPNELSAVATLRNILKKEPNPRKRIMGEGYYLRPNMFQPYNCKNVYVSGVKMINSPMWFMNPVLCENVVIERVRIESHGPNNDGCDPESCKNVLIKDCYFDTGDDCIAIKSGRDEDGRRIRKPAENHLIEGCVMKDGHGGVVIGSEIAGGAKNIYAINCIMDSPNLDRVLRLKTSSARGGVIENVFMKDIKVGRYRDAAITCDMFYDYPGNFIPTIRNIWVENLEVSDGGNYGIFVKAYKASPLGNLKLVNCNINGVKKSFDVNYVKNLTLNNVFINGEKMVVPDSLK